MSKQIVPKRDRNMAKRKPLEIPKDTVVIYRTTLYALSDVDEDGVACAGVFPNRKVMYSGSINVPGALPTFTSPSLMAWEM